MEVTEEQLHAVKETLSDELPDADSALVDVKKNALVRAGILADDKRPSCRVLEPQQTIDRRHPRVEITVTEVV